MTSSRVGHSLTGGGHVLQDMKEAMKVAYAQAKHGIPTEPSHCALFKRRQLSYFIFGSLRVGMCAVIVAPACVPSRARVFKRLSRVENDA